MKLTIYRIPKRASAAALPADWKPWYVDRTDADALDPEVDIDDINVGTFETFAEALDGAWQIIEGEALTALTEGRAHCPLCNGTPQESAGPDPLLWCPGCAELLYPHELVPMATDETRAAYLRRNPEAADDSVDPFDL